MYLGLKYSLVNLLNYSVEDLRYKWNTVIIYFIKPEAFKYKHKSIWTEFYIISSNIFGDVNFLETSTEK